MERIEGVLFDLDGTLLDTEALADKAILQAFGDSLPAAVREERSRDDDRLPWELKKQILGKRGEEWVPIVMQYAQEKWGVATATATEQQQQGKERKDRKGDGSQPPLAPSGDDLWSKWETNLNNLCHHVAECKGATALIEKFAKNGIPMAIATSSRMISVQNKRLKHESMFQHIQAIVTGDDPVIQNGKPSPDIYLEAARRINIPPQRCVVFEDSVAGCQSGKAAGCGVVIAVPDPRMRNDTESIAVFEKVADIILQDLTEFEDCHLVKID